MEIALHDARQASKLGLRHRPGLRRLAAKSRSDIALVVGTKPHSSDLSRSILPNQDPAVSENP